MPTLTAIYTPVYADPADSEPVALFLNADDAAHFMRGHYIDGAIAAGKPGVAVIGPQLSVSWTSTQGSVMTSDAADVVDATPGANAG